ncbi:hypothetical protein QQP08_012609 [Theobroma cacao]|nr:hypothetical protein QQP08_012609 [Theobroma cacao]
MEEPKAMNQKSFILTLCWPREEAFPLKIKIPGNPSDELYLGISEACVCKIITIKLSLILCTMENIETKREVIIIIKKTMKLKIIKHFCNISTTQA